MRNLLCSVHIQVIRHSVKEPLDDDPQIISNVYDPYIIRREVYD